jgi:hypothetical protein
MTYLLIHHEVTSYEKLKRVFDDDAGRRRRSGSKGGRLFCSAENPGHVVALLEWQDLDSAKKFAASYELHEATEWGTVIKWSAEVLDEGTPTDA